MRVMHMFLERSIFMYFPISGENVAKLVLFEGLV